MESPVDVVPILRVIEHGDVTWGLIRIDIGENDLQLVMTKFDPGALPPGPEVPPVPPRPETWDVVDAATGQRINATGGGGGGEPTRARYTWKFRFAVRPSAVLLASDQWPDAEHVELNPLAAEPDSATYSLAESTFPAADDQQRTDVLRRAVIPATITALDGPRIPFGDGLVTPIARELWPGSEIVCFRSVTGALELQALARFDRHQDGRTDHGVSKGSTADMHSMSMDVAYPTAIE